MKKEKMKQDVILERPSQNGASFNQNAFVGYEKTGLNELIADAIIIIDRGELRDKTLEGLIKGILDYV